VSFLFAVLEYNHVDMKMQPIAANRPGFVHRYQSMYVMDDFLSFLSRVSILTRDIDVANLSVCLSVCPSVRYVPVSYENGLTYRHSFFHHTVAQSF